MKKIITGLMISYLFFCFLMYSGFFRDNTDPVEVTNFYFECMKNDEWISTYPVMKEGCFDATELVRIRADIFFANKRLDKLELKLLSLNENTASVQTKLIYENKSCVNSITELEKDRKGNWLIEEVEYTENRDE